MIERDHLFGLFARAAETMKNPTQFIRVRLHDLERIGPGIALMDDHVESQLHRQIQLLLK